RRERGWLRARSRRCRRSVPFHPSRRVPNPVPAPGRLAGRTSDGQYPPRPACRRGLFEPFSRCPCSWTSRLHATRISRRTTTMHHVMIVGGSYAGLAGAMQLGRARRDVVVIDGGKRRNATVAHAHGLLGFDGEPPAAIAAKGREQVRKYSTVKFVEG